MKIFNFRWHVENLFRAQRLFIWLGAYEANSICKAWWKRTSESVEFCSLRANGALTIVCYLAEADFKDVRLKRAFFA